MTKITAVINAHHEGVLLGPALGSFQEAVQFAMEQGIDVECLAVLDRPDDMTREMFRVDVARDIRVLECEHGDSGLARNHAVQAATGDFIAFLDGDDLWSYNWLVEALCVCSENPDATVAHPEANVVFGAERLFFWHADSKAKDFDPGFLRVGNYWSALSFASNSIYRRFPFFKTELHLGYGYEDWHWNCITLAAGIAHRSAPGTVHFIRRRPNSVSRQSLQRDVVVLPTSLSRFDFEVPNR